MRAIKAFVILATILAILFSLGYVMWRISEYFKARGISDLDQCGITIVAFVLLIAWLSIYDGLKK